MENLCDAAITIFEAVENIDNEKYVMPAFQRQYCWSMEQIEKLWDSILLGYPISTFLFWHIDNNNITSDTKFCTFLKNVTFDNRKKSDSPNYDLSIINVKKTDTAVLDGQQRLTSLYLSLFGDAFIRPKNARKVNGDRIVSKLVIELNKNKLTIDEEEYNSKKFDIKFTDKVGKLSPTQFDFKNILNDNYKNKNTRKNEIQKAIENVPADSKEYAQNILETLCSKIYEEPLIRFVEIRNMYQDDALEMFVRFNSGGNPLKKSDITMSILEAYWPEAKTQFGYILVDSYSGFGTDFIIRTALMLYGDVIKSTINVEIATELRKNWNLFKIALDNLATLLKEFRIDISRFASSWNVLLPIIYYIYFNPEYINNKIAIKSYLIRAILFTYFQSGTTTKLQQMKKLINENDTEISIEILNQLNDLRVSEAKIEDILNAEKGSRVAGEALYYLSLDWIKSTLKYEQDHLHPEERFFKTKPANIDNQTWSRWKNNRNRLPNLQFLEGRSNGSKNDMPLLDFYNEMNEEQQSLFIKQAFIPENVSMEFEYFEDFYEERKKILTKKLKELLG
ncbi:MAG: DUF262 domain-containing protein [Lachnospiraceae bacterium]|nr:DUF262 domain-containing protein [Lachnospiraceae bacterium]